MMRTAIERHLGVTNGNRNIVMMTNILPFVSVIDGHGITSTATYMLILCKKNISTPPEPDKGDPVRCPIRLMTETERGLPGGKNPELYVAGKYPPYLPRAQYKYPNRSKAL